MNTKKLILTILTVFTLVAFTGQAFAVEDNWISKSSMPTARFNLHAAPIGGLLYVAGGHDGSTGATNKLEVYDPTSDTWVAKASIPRAVYQGAVGVIDNKLYVVGGWDYPLSGIPTKALQIYDPVTNSWSTGADMPILSGCSVAGVINRKLYVLTACDGYSGFRKYLHVYDPDSNSWVEKAQAPNIHADGAGGVINGKFYVIGGFDGSTVSATLDVYDPATDTWNTKAPMPTARSGLAAGVVNGKLYVVGGNDSTRTSAALEVYDPATNTWSIKAPMLTARSSLAAGVINAQLYVAGGSANNEASVKLEVLSSISATPTPTTTAPTAAPTAAATTAPQTTQQPPKSPVSIPAKFRVGPSVTLRPVTDVIETEQDGIVELFMNNPSLNDVVLNVDASISVPSGFHLSGQGFSQAAGAGVVYGTFSVPPGNARTITVTVKADKSARIGSHSLQFSGLYYPGDNKDNYQPISLTYSVIVKESSKELYITPTAVPTPKIPGLGAVLAMVGVLIIARRLSGNKS